MRIIPPVPVPAGTPGVDTILLSTNVPEDDADPWTAGSYNTGAEVIYDHRVYEVIADPNTSDRPDIGAAADPPTWLDLGVTNRWRMFDGMVGVRTENPGTIAAEIAPGRVVTALAALNLSGAEMIVVMTDPVEGVVYDRTIPLQDNSLIVDWYTYFFNDIVALSDVVLLDLPSYGQAEIAVTIDAGAETARCGELVIGRQWMIGTAGFGTSVGIQSYSVKTRDQFGNFTIVPRAFAKRADYDVSVETNLIAVTQNLLASVRDMAVVYVGDPDRPETIVYGFFRDFQMVLATPTISTCSIEVEGLT